MRRGRAWPYLRAGVLAVCFLYLSGCGPVEPSGHAAGRAALKDQMRQPWEPMAPVFLRDFLVCGPFAEPIPHSAPATPSSEPTVIRPSAFTDYLTTAGGEAAVRPREGQAIPAPDGAPRAWQRYSTEGNLVDLRKAFPQAQDLSCVAYAYATLHRDRPGKAVLALWTRAFLTVYVNGNVIVDPNDREALVAGVYFPLSLEEGDNSLLVRVAGVSRQWPFSLRVVDESDLPMDDPGLLRAEIVSGGGDPSSLAIKVSNDNWLAPPTVTVEVLGVAGQTLAIQQVPLGQTYRFDTAGWADGPYEVRAAALAPDGSPLTCYRSWYKGRWVEEVRRILQEVQRLPADSTDPVVLKKQLVRDILLARLGGDIRPRREVPTPSESDLSRIIAALLEYRETEREQTGSAETGGFFRLAWRDEVDGSPQFARAFLPLGYDPARKYPLVVTLHGYNARNPSYAAKEPGERHDRLAERYDVIYLMPNGRGNTGYRGIGEADVMRAVGLAKRRFHVDDERVYLTGQSMGGGGAWYVGTRHTDVFAAIAPTYGGWDYHADANDREVARWPPLRVALAEADSSFAGAENLLHTPVFINVGDKDSPGLVGSLRYATRMLQRWGYGVRYWEHPRKGHGGLDIGDALVQWFLAHSLQRAPRHVRLRAGDLSGASAHWVHAEQQEDPFAFMLADASVAGSNTVLLLTQNILQVRLNPPPELLDPAQPVRVIWNRALAYEGKLPPSGQIILWAQGYAPGKFVKKPMGPTPFALVVGTTSTDPRMKRVCRLLADQARNAWATWQHVEPRTFIDTEMTDQQIRSYSLILYGGPTDNAVTARLAREIPLQITPTAITLDGKSFDVRDGGVRMTYAHPLNADRLVTLIAGTSADGMLHAGRLSDRVDFVITDGRIGSEEDDYLKNAVAWGRFDHNWRLNEKYLTPGDPASRASTPVYPVPRLLTASSAQGRLMLSDLLESASCGSFARRVADRNWQGKPLRLGGRTFSRGIAVACWPEPCRAEWDLTGGNWKHLRATIGIEVQPRSQDASPENRPDTHIVFVVRGDGKELYKSPPFGADSRPVDIDVDVAGVAHLELEVFNVDLRGHVASSVDWADIRLEK